MRLPASALGLLVCSGALTVIAASPGLYLSSVGAGWEGVEAHAFVEPEVYEGWVSRILPALSLVLFRGGACDGFRG